MPIFVGNSTVNTAIANSTLTVDQTQNFAYATSNRNSIRPSLNLDFTRSQTVDPRITFTRASSATYFNSRGVLTTATNDVPRIDYNPSTGACNGLLIEKESTNLITYSGNVATFGAIFSTLTANAAISPDGTTTAALMIPSVDLNNNHYINKVWNGSVGNSITFTVSIFAKTAGYQWIRMNVGNAMGGGYLFFDIINGVVGVYGGVSNPVIQACGNGWFRCSYQYTTPATGTGDVGHQIYGTPSNNNFSNWSGNGTSGYYFWGAQVEQLSFLTSYIATGASTATRSVEVASVNIQNYFNTTQGSIAMGFIQNYPTATGAFPWGLFSLQDAAATNSSRARIGGSGSTVINFDSFSASGLDSGQSTSNSWTLGGLNKIGLSWSYASLSTYNKIYALNGVAGSSTPSIALPANNNILYIGAWNNATFPLTGWVQGISYYPVALSNTELQTLTS